MATDADQENATENFRLRLTSSTDGRLGSIGKFCPVLYTLRHENNNQQFFINGISIPQAESEINLAKK